MMEVPAREKDEATEEMKKRNHSKQVMIAHMSSPR
jgi:hypothetical protein